MGAFYEMFRALPNYYQDPFTNRQAQFVAFFKAGPTEFDSFQSPLATDHWIKAIKNTFFLLGTPAEL